jgi:hypothetical protein
MIAEERKCRPIRELAKRHRPILLPRSHEYWIRRFSILPLNFEAQYYFEMIDWPNTAISEPPILKGNSEHDIEMFVACGETS